MIIKLNGANFSENNIGKITIRRELSDFAKAVFAKYTKSMSVDKKYAFDAFVDEMKESGVWGKVSKLYIPALAGAVGEMLLNIKTLEVDAVPSSMYTLSDGGIVKGAGTGDAIVSINASQQNLHMLAFNTTEIPTGRTASMELFGNLVSSDGSNFNMVRVQIGADNITAASTAVNSSIKNVSLTAPNEYFDRGIGFKGVSQTTLGNIALGYGERTALNTNPIDTDGTYTNFQVRLLGYPNKSDAIPASWGILSIGSGLSLSECLAYDAAAKKFMESVLR